MEVDSDFNYSSELDEENDEKKKKAHTCSLICPSLEYLSKARINTNVVCTVPNCEEIFSQESALNLHLKKVHRIDQKKKIDDLIVTKARSRLQKLNDNCNCKYYCPIDKCKFNLSSKNSSTKYLPTFHSLKNHFIRMHGKKEFACSSCLKKFSIKSEMERHETNCGKFFKCQTCDIKYSTYQGLFKHLTKKNHLMESIDKKSSPLNVPKTNLRVQSIKTNATCNKKPLKILSKQLVSNTNSCQLLFVNSTNTHLASQSIFLVAAPQIATPLENQQNEFLSASLNKFTAVGCQTINRDLNESFSSFKQEVGSQTIFQSCNHLFPSENQFNMSSSTSPLNFESLYSSQETQTIIQNLNVAPNLSPLTTQETGSQTVFFSQDLDSFQTSLLVPPPSPSPLASIQKTSTATSTNFQTEDFSCLDAGTSTYLDMYLSDISTQTQLTTSQNVPFNLEQDLVDSFYYMEETNNRASNYLNNLVPTKSFRDMSTNSDHHNLHFNDRESMTTPTNSSIFSNSTCQTENFYFGVNHNTNSTQTQTSKNTYFNCNNHAVDTITQTEWTN